MKFSIFDSITGKLLRIGECPEEVVGLQAHAGEIVLPVESERFDRRLDLATLEVVDLPPAPSPNHTYDYTLNEWVDARSLQEVREAAWRRIKAVRNQHEFGGFTWDGDVFDSDQISQSRIQGAAQLAQIVPGFSTDWTLADNSIRTLDATEMLAVGVALGVHVTTTHAIARGLRAAILAAETVAGIEGVAWPE